MEFKSKQVFSISYYSTENGEDRFIILDNDGFDATGEHFSLEEAKEQLIDLIEDEER